ncbi:unnamed protein product [Phytophthora lilii]|uniref:Unnamed protein product n=1 Tax=Phytophthora lilii TaxID=2077276 RepID=A0A9W6YLD4_9STRA|nr:unnamed protein product [Phytophthora lilii]
MFFFNPRIISGSGGSYGDNADFNVAELKAIMKNLIIHDRPQKTQAAVWATDLDKSIRKVDASAQTTGGDRTEIFLSLIETSSMADSPLGLCVGRKTESPRATILSAFKSVDPTI